MALCLTKFSILLFYHRLFGRTSIRIPLMILGFVVTGWGIAVVSTSNMRVQLSFTDHKRSAGSYNNISV